DRSDVPVERVPPTRGMPAPPLEDRRRRHAANEADRGLAVAREDPILLVERERGAGLDRLVVPGNRVRPDPTLAVVDERALVEHAQEDHAPVELDQVLIGEPHEDQARTVRASRSATKVASVTSPRSSPSACSGSGWSQRTTSPS